jgi:hypothetical protein
LVEEDRMIARTFCEQVLGGRRKRLGGVGGGGVEGGEREGVGVVPAGVGDEALELVLERAAEAARVRGLQLRQLLRRHGRHPPPLPGRHCQQDAAATGQSKNGAERDAARGGRGELTEHGRRGGARFD